MAMSPAWQARIRRALPPTVLKPVEETWHQARRWLRFQRAEVCLVSYPKAGRTWLRLLIGRALEQRFQVQAQSPMEIEDLADHDRRIPRIMVTHDRVVANLLPDELERDKRRYRGKAVVLLVRDPRDVVVSSYFHATKRDRAYHGTLAEYVREPRGGIDTILTFHAFWRDALHVPRRTLVVRYEDLAAAPGAELERVLDFLGFSADAGDLEEVVRFGSFENMQRLEQAAAFGPGRLEARDPNDRDSFKVRRGKVGGYRDYLDPESISLLDAKLAAAELEPFGYGVSTI
jgi:hypothetical protein